MAKKITIFSIDLFDDGFKSTPFHKFCIASWENLKNAIITAGYECEIKIFDYNDDEIKAFIEDCSEHYNYDQSVSRKADAARMYILSKYENYFYLDMDCYVMPTVEFTDAKFIRSHFYALYNSDDTSDFETFYAAYKAGELKGLDDKSSWAAVKQGEDTTEAYAGIIHLSRLDNHQDTSVWQFVDEDSDLIHEHYKDYDNYVFISKTAEIEHVVKLHGDETLVSYVEAWKESGSPADSD